MTRFPFSFLLRFLVGVNIFISHLAPKIWKKKIVNCPILTESQSHWINSPFIGQEKSLCFPKVNTCNYRLSKSMGVCMELAELRGDNFVIRCLWKAAISKPGFEWNTFLSLSLRNQRWNRETTLRQQARQRKWHGYLCSVCGVKQQFFPGSSGMKVFRYNFFRRPYRCLSITLKVILSLFGSYKSFTSDWLWIDVLLKCSF